MSLWLYKKQKPNDPEILSLVPCIFLSLCLTLLPASLSLLLCFDVSGASWGEVFFLFFFPFSPPSRRRCVTAHHIIALPIKYESFPPPPPSLQQISISQSSNPNIGYFQLVEKGIIIIYDGGVPLSSVFLFLLLFPPFFPSSFFFPLCLLVLPSRKKWNITMIVSGTALYIPSLVLCRKRLGRYTLCCPADIYIYIYDRGHSRFTEAGSYAGIHAPILYLLPPALCSNCYTNISCHITSPGFSFRRGSLL